MAMSDAGRSGTFSYGIMGNDGSAVIRFWMQWPLLSESAANHCQWSSRPTSRQNKSRTTDRGQPVASDGLRAVDLAQTLRFPALAFKCFAFQRLAFKSFAFERLAFKSFAFQRLAFKSFLEVQ
jgi:hypothetical protein